MQSQEALGNRRVSWTVRRRTAGMTVVAHSGLRALFHSAPFLRLWAIGSCVNTMRWFEVLAAALFTMDVTGSGLAVAVVSAARTMPMFLFGAFAGVVTEALNRKHVVVVGQMATCLASATVAVLGWLGLANPWHIALTATVSGIVWSTENATRRRMVGECVEPAMVSRALALDTMSNSVTRLFGPLLAGVLYQRYGLGGCFTASAVVYAFSSWLALGLRYRQETRRFVLSHVPRDLMEGLRYVRGDVVIGGVLAVTVVMNLLGFPYSALVAPIGRLIFHVSPSLIGILAAAEAFGAALGGALLTTREPRIDGRILMVGGSMLYLACVVSMPLMPLFWLSFGVLAFGGFGSAAFSNMQTSLIVLNTPVHIRSRLMGLLTVCIGMGPLGILLVGTIANFTGPRFAIDLVASTGFVLTTCIGIVWRRREAARRN